MLIMRKILANVQSTDGSILDGFKWVLLLAFSEVLRTVFFTWMHLTNCRTAARLRSACLAMLYKKIVNLHDLGGTTAGEVNNYTLVIIITSKLLLPLNNFQFIAIFSNDGQRVYDLIVFGPMIASVPIVVVVSALHILYLFHPVTLTCLLVFFLFYFAQVRISCIGTKEMYMVPNCLYDLTSLAVRHVVPAEEVEEESDRSDGPSTEDDRRDLGQYQGHQNPSPGGVL